MSDEKNMNALSDDELEQATGGKADGEFEYRTATQADLAQIGSGPYCPILSCRERLGRVVDYNNKTVYYTCYSCHIVWIQKILSNGWVGRLTELMLRIRPGSESPVTKDRKLMELLSRGSDVKGSGV